MLHVPVLFIAESEGRGRGVFTANQNMNVECINTIEPGNEIFINYVGGGTNAPKLWFVPV